MYITKIHLGQYKKSATTMPKNNLKKKRGHIYPRLVNTKGVAPGKLRALASDCSFPSLVASSVLPEPEKGQNPLDLEPLPPIFSYSTLFP